MAGESKGTVELFVRGPGPLMACRSARQLTSERAQELRAIAAPGAAVHAGKRRGRSRGQAFQHPAGIFRMREVIHLGAKGQ